LAKQAGFDEAEGADVFKLLESQKEKLMQLFEELHFVRKYPEAHICDKNRPIQDLM
jgi:hypothetical protein